jgi:TPR repeat protein
LNWISIATATTLTGCSESTLRRRIAAGSVQRKLEPGANGRLMIDLESIRPLITILMTEDDLALFLAADGGNAIAQTDLALFFLAQDNSKNAIYWLEAAVKQEYANAMHYLGHCYLNGHGVAKDANLGLMWLSKAAVGGHLISQAQMKVIHNRLSI